MFTVTISDLPGELTESELTEHLNSLCPQHKIANISMAYDNAQEIEDRLVACGFDVVEPEKLTFAGQVALFSSAAVVVGATGAAFANLVFCRPDCRVVILIAELEGTSYYYWQNIASACGGRVCYVLGQIEERRFRSIHSDFRVDPDDVLAAVQGPVADAVRPAGAVRR